MKHIFTFLLMICIAFSSAALAEDTRPPLRLGDAAAETDYWQEHGIPTAQSDTNVYHVMLRGNGQQESAIFVAVFIVPPFA